MGKFSYSITVLAVNFNVSCLQTYKPEYQSNQFFHYTNMEEYNLKYHDDVYTDPVGRGVLPYKRLRGCAAGGGRIFMTGWTIMGLHFQ